MLKRGFQFAPGYRLQEFLGRGQFGQVWRATAPGGAAAAVKFIDLSDGQGQKEYEGVKRVKQIRHANLMPITAIWLLDAQGKVIEEAPDEAIETIDLSAAQPRGASAVFKGVDPHWLVVSMLLGGKSLQQRLRECTEDGLPGIPPKELISYMDESAKGLDFLNAPQHDLGDGPISIQHCDVKPANIVLIGSSAVVCDFGLARILTRNQVTATSAAGTPAYMAPEAISGKPCRTSDQYSLAVTYYHLRTGALPVNDGSLWEVLDAHRQGKLKLGLVPEPEQEVLRKATDLDWEQRFETNVDMVDALREALRASGDTKPSFVPKSGQINVQSAEAGEPAATAPNVTAPSTGGGAAVAGHPTEALATHVDSPGLVSTVANQPAAASTLASIGATQSGAVLKTLLLSDIVDSTKMVERLGDEGAAALFRKHDRAARDLLAKYGGREIDKTDGFLMLFERPLNAALYALAYHQALDDLSEELKTDLSARVGIHIGEVIVYENPPEDVARGAKPIEVEGLAKPTAARLMSLAQSKQTLITRGFYDVAKRSAVGASGETEKKMVWRTHGSYLFKGVEDPVAVYEVGVEGLSPLTPPPDSAKVKRVEAGQPSGTFDVTVADVAKMDSSAKQETKAPSATKTAEQKPGFNKVFAGLGAIAAVALIVGIISAMSGSDPGTMTGENSNEGNGGVVGSGTDPGITDPEAVGDAEQMLANALETYDENEAVAVELFRKALSADPGMTAVPMIKKSGHKSGVFFAEVTGDGKFLITAADMPLLWDMSGDGSSTPLPGHEPVVEALGINLGNNRLVTAGFDNVPLVWDLSLKDVVGSSLRLEGNDEGIEGHADRVRAASWHPNKSVVFTISNDPSIGVWQVGRATPEAPNGKIEAANRIMTNETMVAVAVDPGGRWLVTIDDPLDGSPAALAYRMSDVLDTLQRDAGPVPIRVTTNSVQAKKIAFASDHDGNAVLAVGDAQGSVSLYELSDSAKLLSRKSQHVDFVESLRVVAGENADVVVSGSSDGSAMWWQSGATDREQTQVFSGQAISSVDATADGRWVAVGSHDGSVWLWDATADEFIATKFQTGAMVHVVRLDPLSRWLMAGCDDGIIYMWDLKRAKLKALAKPSRPQDEEFEGELKTIDAKPLS